MEQGLPEASWRRGASSWSMLPVGLPAKGALPEVSGGPSLVSTCTRNPEVPVPGSASMLESRVIPPIENLFIVQHRIRLRPRYLKDVSQVDTRTTIQGEEISAPICIAPTGFHRLAWPDGEMSTARGENRPHLRPPFQGPAACRRCPSAGVDSSRVSPEKGFGDREWLELRRVEKQRLTLCLHNIPPKMEKIPIVHDKEWLGWKRDY